ncbi:HEX [Mytilus coruscus]|uniref:HEX n=1 Tax=Mytilus coruscus TaxID=42192 RepID=A0A6J8AP68_MYTCO|nr:HEX [Mytilus coruscus]
MLRHTELPVLLGKFTAIMWDDMLRHTELPVLLGKFTAIMWDDMLRHTELPVLLGKLTAIMWDDMLRHTELPVLLGKFTAIMWDDMLRHTELPVLLGKFTAIMWDDMLRHTELPVLLGKLTVIMWDDMLRYTELPVLLESGLAGLVEPMIWHYLTKFLMFYITESGLAGLVEPMIWHYLTKFLMFYITESGLAGLVEPMIWHYLTKFLMFYITESGLAGLVEPMIWHYLTKFLLPPDIWDKFSKLFPNIWLGSAFKGATGSNMYVTNIGYHIENHLVWLALQEKEKQKFQTIRGYAVTGWSRYDHYAVLCELLPQALPSLGICLSVLNKGTFNADLHNGVSELLKFKSHLPISPFQCLGAPPCDFPGHKVYRDMLDFNHLEASYEDLMHNESIFTWMNEYQIKRNFINPVHVGPLLNAVAKTITECCSKVIGEFSYLEKHDFSHLCQKYSLRQLLKNG